MFSWFWTRSDIVEESNLPKLPPLPFSYNESVDHLAMLRYDQHVWILSNITDLDYQYLKFMSESDAPVKTSLPDDTSTEISLKEFMAQLTIVNTPVTGLDLYQAWVHTSTGSSPPLPSLPSDVFWWFDNIKVKEEVVQPNETLPCSLAEVTANTFIHVEELWKKRGYGQEEEEEQ